MHIRPGLLLLCLSLLVTHSLASQTLIVASNDPRERSGVVRAINALSPWEYASDPIPVGFNSTLHSAFGRLFVLSSEENTVRVIDPDSWSLDRTLTLAPAQIPAGIAVVSPDTAYLTLANAPTVLRLDLLSGKTTPILDLSTLAPPRAVPELGTMAIDDGRLFVQVRHLDRDDPASLSYLAAMNIATETLIDVDPSRDGIQAIELVGTAPKGRMQILSRQLWLNASGGFFDAGGIESVNLDTLRSEGLSIREADGLTGADLNAFILLNDREGYLTYSTDLLASSHLHRFNAGGEVDPTELHVVVDYITPAMAFDATGGLLFIPSGGFSDTGIHVFDASTGQRLTNNPILTAGPPTDLLLIPEPSALFLLSPVLLLLRHRGHREHRGS